MSKILNSLILVKFRSFAWCLQSPQISKKLLQIQYVIRFHERWLRVVFLVRDDAFLGMDSTMMNNNSAELREWAARCENMAATAATDDERASLLRKCEALRALAATEDWLIGNGEQATVPAADPGADPGPACPDGASA